MDKKSCLLALAMVASGNVQASENLYLDFVAPDGQRITVQQDLLQLTDNYIDAMVEGASESNEYLAIRCGGPWGAQRYRMRLPSGPGYQLTLQGDSIRVRILLHSVINEDQKIDAMKMHCEDTEPKAIVHALADFQLTRGQAIAKQLPLANGLVLEYEYAPTALRTAEKNNTEMTMREARAPEGEKATISGSGTGGTIAEYTAD